MKLKRTLWEKLSVRYQLVFRNEEDLAERSTFFFTYRTLLAVLLAAILVFFVIGLLLAKTVLSGWFDPKYTQAKLTRQVYSMAMRVDSLTEEANQRQQFIDNLRSVLGGDTSRADRPQNALVSPEKTVVSIGSLELTALDSQFKKDFEQAEIALLDPVVGKNRRLQDLLLMPPVNGFVSGRYNPPQGLEGVRISTQPNEPIKAIANGTVVFSALTPDAGYVLVVQHADNLLSVYRNGAQVFKKAGSFVTAGTVLALTGSGQKGHLPWLYFELWCEGRSLNPERFVVF